MIRSTVRIAFFLLAGVWLASPAPSAAATWRFEVALDAPAAQLRVEACHDAALERVRFVAARSAGTWLRDAQRSSAKPLSISAGSIDAAGWEAGECLRTRVDLAAAARADRNGLGGQADRYWRLDPRQWLWRPRDLDPQSTVGFDLPGGWSVSAPWRPLEDGRHRLGQTPADWPSSVVFGRFSEQRIQRPGGVLRLAVIPLGDPVPTAGIRRWIESVADDLLHSHGRLPLPDAQVLVMPLPGVSSAVPWGQVQRGGGSAVHLFPGLDAGAARWRADWTATHELAHLLHPYLGDRGRWLSEGLASYYQNVLRARSGELDAAVAWDKLRAGFGRGQRATPEQADPLGRTAYQRQRGSTMRVYWAGAAFWLESDLALREQGGSLDAVLERFARRHLPSERLWTPDEYIAALERLAPGGDWQARYRRYADGARFPEIDPRVARLASGRPEAAPPWMRAIMEPHIRDFAERSETSGEAATLSAPSTRR